MTLVELVQILKSSGYPVTYSHFKETSTKPVPAPPYITYLEDPSSNMFADNKVYKPIKNIRVELYTDLKDLVAEEKIEELLNENEIPFDTDEAWIESEQLFQRIYEVGLI